ncbi:ACP phosphodiesterase [Olivibacter sitiensis]|uniref:ACP phosphodiesterase n=1 Tax=Olivibacter sitiensis TaxID=376470 RepID=UPI00041CFD20|nr:hypothetical protein [Olivibacter sitiensis]
MNFLSHFYFESKNSDPEHVLGAVLPDLLKITHKNTHIFPEKHSVLFQEPEPSRAILQGWIRHIEVDKLFHSSFFFKQKTHELKGYISPAIKNTAIRPFFLAHIALELLLDRLLMINNWVHERDFYLALKSCSRDHIDLFLVQAGIEDRTPFFLFFDNFLQESYLGSYRRMESVTYALNQICKRIWPDTLTKEEEILLTKALRTYEVDLKQNYKAIFNEIARQLSTKKLNS